LPKWNLNEYSFGVGKFKYGYFYILDHIQVRQDYTVIQIHFKSEVKGKVFGYTPKTTTSTHAHSQSEVINPETETIDIESEIILSSPNITEHESENKIPSPPSPPFQAPTFAPVLKNPFPNPLIMIGGNIYPAFRIEIHPERNTQFSIAQIYFPTIVGKKAYLSFLPDFDYEFSFDYGLFNLSIGQDERSPGTNIWMLLVIVSLIFLIFTLFFTFLSSLTGKENLSDLLIYEIKHFDREKKKLLENVDSPSFFSYQNDKSKEIRKSSITVFFDKSQDLIIDYYKRKNANQENNLHTFFIIIVSVLVGLLLIVTITQLYSISSVFHSSIFPIEKTGTRTKAVIRIEERIIRLEKSRDRLPVFLLCVALSGIAVVFINGSLCFLQAKRISRLESDNKLEQYERSVRNEIKKQTDNYESSIIDIESKIQKISANIKNRRRIFISSKNDILNTLDYSYSIWKKHIKRDSRKLLKKMMVELKVLHKKRSI
jgi:hypothetical protein